MGTVPLLSDEEAAPKARAVFDEIRVPRETDEFDNVRRSLARVQALLRATRDLMKPGIAPGALAPLVNDMVRITVSVANGGAFRVPSYSAAAIAKDVIAAQQGERAAVGMRTNAFATGLRVEIDEAFRV